MKGPLAILAAATALAASGESPAAVPEGNARHDGAQRVATYFTGSKGWHAIRFAGPNQRQRRKRERQTGRR